MGAYESPADCNDDGVSDPALLSAVSRKANISGPGGWCDLPAAVTTGCMSEPRQGGITELRFTFDGPAAACLLASVEEANCDAPVFVGYEGTWPTCVPAGNELICTFNPALANAQTYRFNLTHGSAVIRGLVGDVNNDGRVNATDRSIVVAAWTSPEHFSCETDLNNDGATNATDRSIVVAAWTGQGTNCAPTPGLGEGGESMGAQGGDAPLGPEESAGDSVAESDEVGPAAPTWTVVESPLLIRIRPLGGGDPTVNLLPSAAYELHYAGALHPAEGYLVRASGCASACLAAATPAITGVWSQTRLFEYLPLENDARVLDDLPAGQADPGEGGYLEPIPIIVPSI